MNRSRQGRANQRQTPLPADVLAPRMPEGDLYDEVRLIRSGQGRRGGLIPTAPVRRVTNADLPRPQATQQSHRGDATSLRCANCGQPGGYLKRNTAGRLVHDRGCPRKT